MPLKIHGYGACMIAGFSLPAGQGFLEIAAQHVRERHRREVALEVTTLGGFPADRAPKHFAKRVLIHRPHIVVLQFGSLDASAPLRNGFLLRHLRKPTTHGGETVAPVPPSAADRLKWKLRSLGSELLFAPPVTPLNDYLAAMREMVRAAQAAGSRVVVVSPFVMANARGHRFARVYTDALRGQLPADGNAVLLDAHALLSPAPRHEMLLRDGFHLSPAGQRRVGEVLGELLAKLAAE
jgi:lysophospholipase L1-like esterase